MRLRTRLFHALATALVLCGACLAQEFDQYGGWTGLSGHNTSGFFRTEKINGRYWLVTPENHVFWSVGPCVAQYMDTWGGYCPVTNQYSNPYGNKAKYNNSYANWKTAHRQRLTDWAFNTHAAWGVTDVANTAECVRVLWTTGQAQSRGCRMINGNFC